MIRTHCNPSVYNVSSRAAELDHVDRWAESNNLRLNRAKSVEIIFTDSKCKPTLNLPPPILDIRCLTSVKMLGITITTCLLLTTSVTSSANARSLCTLLNCCAITAWATTRWGMSTRPSFSQSYCMRLQPGGYSPVQPINNAWKHQYGVLYGPACIWLMILRFLNWSQIWTTTYLQKFGTILTTFSTNFYLIKLITITIFDHVLILFH